MLLALVLASPVKRFISFQVSSIFGAVHCARSTLFFRHLRSVTLVYLSFLLSITRKITSLIVLTVFQLFAHICTACRYARNTESGCNTKRVKGAQEKHDDNCRLRGTLGFAVLVVFINITKTVCLYEQHQKINR